jgi:ribonuclease HII
VGCPTLTLERALWKTGVRVVAGVDEAGRGPLAGPVVAAAVIFAPDVTPPDGINDSKVMTAAAREAAAVRVRRTAAAWALGAASVREIDRENILQATARAMRRALLRLQLAPQRVLLDGLPLAQLGRPHDAIVDGDARSVSIAAASILAKVTRDHLMVRLAARYPAFAWADNKGYGTPDHLAALRAVGPTPHHRMSFAPVRQLMLL